MEILLDMARTISLDKDQRGFKVINIMLGKMPIIIGLFHSHVIVNMLNEEAVLLDFSSKIPNPLK